MGLIIQLVHTALMDVARPLQAQIAAIGWQQLSGIQVITAHRIWVKIGIEGMVLLITAIPFMLPQMVR